MSHTEITRNIVHGVFVPWAMLLLLGGISAGGMDLPSNTADVLYQKDGLTGLYDWPSVYAKGDYNGDGYKDVVMMWSSYPTYWKAFVIPGGPTLTSGLTEERAVMMLSINGGNYPDFYSADIDNDGFDDFILSLMSYTSGQGHQRVEIYYGSDPLRPTINLGVSPDWKIITNSTATTSSFEVVAGDVTGDGKTDLLIDSPSSTACGGEVYLIPGNGSRRTGTFNASSGAGVITFRGSAGTCVGGALLMGEFNNDGKRDLVFQMGKSPPGRSGVGMTYVVFGSTALPSPYDFGTRAPNVAIWGDALPFYPSLAGDVNGDKLDELYLQRAYPDPTDGSQSLNVLVPGSGFISGASVIDLRKTSANYKPVVEVDKYIFLANLIPAMGDFDGDGQADLISISTFPATTPLWLSNDIESFPSSTLSSASLTVPNILGSSWGSSMGDVNGDGFEDLVVAEKGSTGTFWGLVIYGFHPLDNPAIHFPERGVSPTERQADFSVEGDPTEMRLDGDGDPLFMNRWIPFQRSMRLSLTPGTGSRTVGVTFRNRFGRESSRAQDTVTLGVEGVATRPLTTVIRRGGAPLRVECQLSNPGHLKVWVMDRRGATIATLVDEERAAGLWPVEWDGRNGAGEPAAPGIYILHIETPDVTEKKNIVVQ